MLHFNILKSHFTSWYLLSTSWGPARAGALHAFSNNNEALDIIAIVPAFMDGKLPLGWDKKLAWGLPAWIWQSRQWLVWTICLSMLLFLLCSLPPAYKSNAFILVLLARRLHIAWEKCIWEKSRLINISCYKHSPANKGECARCKREKHDIYFRPISSIGLSSFPK